jgi:hypothetical protein
LYQQLDLLQSVRQEARHDLLVESRKHSAVKLLRQIPAIGPIRAALPRREILGSTPNLTAGALVDRVLRVESRTGAVTVVSRWIFGLAFAAPPQSGLAWFCFLFPLIEPDWQISRIRLSEKTHHVPCDAACNF